jgi:tripartite-type tricarboxylate transporter receptor subunit TctC
VSVVILGERAMARLAGLLFTIVLAVAAGSLRAQDYPTRPIKVIVPFNPGGPTDVIARAMNDLLAPRLGQNLVIENRPGGATLVGMQALSLAAPDGYTLGFIANSTLTLPATMEKLPVDVVRDFTPVTKVVQGAQLLLVSAKLPATTVPELVAYAKANPGTLNFGFSGTQELVHSLFNQVGGIRTIGVPYKGQDDVTRAFQAGDIQILFENIAVAKRLEAEGKARIIATAGTTRSKLTPELPTITETLPRVAWPFWYYVLGPAKLPESVVSKLYAAIVEVAKEPEFAKRVAPFGTEPLTTPPRELSSAIVDEVALWVKTANAAGLKKQ